MRLICLPFAGGNASTYTGWVDDLPGYVELVAIQPPGRGRRTFEAAHTSMDSLIGELLPAIRPYLEKPFVLLGHSMGGLISFELVRQLRRLGLQNPQHLILSASRPPHFSGEKRIHDLPDDQFLAELKNLNGTPEVCLQDRELMEILTPMLRADFRIADTYRYFPNEKLPLRVSVFGGEEDNLVSETILQGWQEHFTMPVDLKLFPGDHFFIEGAKNMVINEVVIIIEGACSSLVT